MPFSGFHLARQTVEQSGSHPPGKTRNTPFVTKPEHASKRSLRNPAQPLAAAFPLVNFQHAKRLPYASKRAASSVSYRGTAQNTPSLQHLMQKLRREKIS
jgi:hypothetical protein